jgi:hypothetical protein
MNSRIDMMSGRGVAPMANGGAKVDRRVERVTFETDRYVVVGDVSLPPEGYQSRFSDSMNRDDIPFVPLTNVEITERDTGRVTQRPFIVLGKAHVRLAFPN